MYNKNILVVCAHDDDSNIAMGGSIMKFIDEGYNIIQIIFSKGEMSHPHLKKSIVSKTRKKETEEIAEDIGIKKLIYFNLPDTQVRDHIDSKVKKELKKIIQKYKPEKIFTVSIKDTHPDHRAVHKAVLEVVNSIKIDYPVYGFQVWNIFSRNLPLLQIDISDYFKEKIRIMKMHKSQLFYIYLQLIPVYLRARLNGLKYHCKYTEVFYKVK